MKKKFFSVVLVMTALMMLFISCKNGTETTSGQSEAVSQNEESDEPSTSREKKEIYLLAAASLTDVMNEMIADFETKNPEYKVVVSYGASGALQTQIEEGAPADVFFSAGMKQMNALDEKNLLETGTRHDLLKNEIVLIVPKGNPAHIDSFDDLATDKMKTIGLGEFTSVPVGEYSKELLENLGILDKVEPKAVFGNDVRTVLNWVEVSEVDCGIVYRTDALVMKDAVEIISSAPENSVKPAIYPVSVLSEGNEKEGAKLLVDYLTNEDSMKLFESYGFLGTDEEE